MLRTGAGAGAGVGARVGAGDDVWKVDAIFCNEARADVVNEVFQSPLSPSEELSTAVVLGAASAAESAAVAELAAAAADAF